MSMDGAANLTIRGLVELWAEKTPNAAALLAPDRAAMTYAQLLAQIAESRAFLHDAGIRRNDRVAVVLRNGPEMAAAFLSVADAAVCAKQSSIFTFPIWRRARSSSIMA